MVKLLVLNEHDCRDRKTAQTFPLESHSAICGWKVCPHCSLRSHAGVCGWLELWQGFHSSGALKMPMMPRLRRRLMTSTPMVPRKEGIAPWAMSAALRDIMSAITPSIWKWVPTTALTWKSWWLWPV